MVFCSVLPVTLAALCERCSAGSSSVACMCRPPEGPPWGGRVAPTLAHGQGPLLSGLKEDRLVSTMTSGLGVRQWCRALLPRWRVGQVCGCVRSPVCLKGFGSLSRCVGPSCNFQSHQSGRAPQHFQMPVAPRVNAASLPPQAKRPCAQVNSAGLVYCPFF